MTQIMLRLDFFFYILILLGFPAAEMHSGHMVTSFSLCGEGRAPDLL